MAPVSKLESPGPPKSFVINPFIPISLILSIYNLNDDQSPFIRTALIKLTTKNGNSDLLINGVNYYYHTWLINWELSNLPHCISNSSLPWS